MTLTPGKVFISYAHKDLDRVEPIIKYLEKKGFNIWWDDNIATGTLFRPVIQSQLEEAACVVVVWTVNSVGSQFVCSEASFGQHRGILLPVLLDSNAIIPVGFTEIQHSDLTLWDGTESEKVQRLAKCIGSLVARGTNKAEYKATIPENPWYFDTAPKILTQLRDLTSQIRSIRPILVLDNAPIEDLIGALREVSKTYRVVNSAIIKFTTPAIGTETIDPKPFFEMEGGILKTEIHNGHGHCSLIKDYYEKIGGIRDWIQDKLSPENLQKTDVLFGQLSLADGDLFRPLEIIGDILTNESTAIINLLSTEQESMARQRIRDGRMKLAPVREQLSVAMRELQDVEHELGYTDTLQ